MRQNVCTICRQKSDTTEIDVLDKILGTLSSVPEKIPTKKHQWGICYRCKYGIPCPAMKRMDSDAKTKTEVIEKKLQSIIDGKNKEKIRRVMELCRGYFPSVYHSLEQKLRNM